MQECNFANAILQNCARVSFLREMIRYLKYGEQALPEAVKIVTRLFLHVTEIELSTEDLFKGQVTKNKLKGVRVVTSCYGCFTLNLPACLEERRSR